MLCGTQRLCIHSIGPKCYLVAHSVWGGRVGVRIPVGRPSSRESLGCVRAPDQRTLDTTGDVGSNPIVPPQGREVRTTKDACHFHAADEQQHVHCTVYADPRRRSSGGSTHQSRALRGIGETVSRVSYTHESSGQHAHPLRIVGPAAKTPPRHGGNADASSARSTTFIPSYAKAKRRDC